MKINRLELTTFLNKLLLIDEYADYGPNGLQIEGSEEIKKIAFSVSASRDVINTAIYEKADALVVHHGLFWKFHGVRTLTGPFGKRVLPLVRNNINLLAYHLPLDGNQTFGNAAMIAQKLDLVECSPFGDYKRSVTGQKGKFKKKIKVKELKSQLENILNHPILLSSENSNDEVSTIGIITGGANAGWIDASKEGLDCYLTGEMSEHDWHEAKEWGVHMFAGGHHATEKFGIQKLKDLTEEKFPQLECIFIDSKNPA